MVQIRLSEITQSECEQNEIWSHLEVGNTVMSVNILFPEDVFEHLI